MHDLASSGPAAPIDHCDDRRDDATHDGCGFVLSWPEDWHACQATRPNILVTGPVSAVNAFLRSAQSAFLAPIRATGARGKVAPPAGGTLIVYGIERLNRHAQRTLLGWMNAHEQARTQFISTASAPVFPLVEAGIFSDELYYRLNTVHLRVRVPLAADAQRRCP